MNKNQIEIKKRIEEPLSEEELAKLKEHSIPSYLTEIYTWAYVNPKNIDRLDNLFVYHFILFGQGNKLMNTYLDEINSGVNMLQVAHVYGNILTKVAEKIGNNGKLDIMDVVPYQIEKAKNKVKNFKNVDLWVQNAADPFHKNYDVIGIYFLLHEVPDDIKTRIINNALNSILETNGKVVFIDYHSPSFLNPVRQILKLVNTFLEPFANSLWDKEISSFTNKANLFNWKKTTFFGGTYQKVVVTKKETK